MPSKKKIFSNPIFWVAVGGIGLAYYMYSKKQPAAAAPAAAQTTTTNNAVIDMKTQDAKNGIFGSLVSPADISSIGVDGSGNITGMPVIDPGEPATKRSLGGAKYDPLTGEQLSDRYTNRIGA